MKKCRQCGLPYPACNALAMLRDGARYMKLGRTEEAMRYFEGAEQFRCEFEEARKGSHITRPPDENQR